jgi:hypothetical protein
MKLDIIPIYKSTITNKSSLKTIKYLVNIVYTTVPESNNHGFDIVLSNKLTVFISMYWIDSLSITNRLYLMKVSPVDIDRGV